jgi:hypothetical protein
MFYVMAPQYGQGKNVSYTGTAGTTADFPVGAQAVQVTATTDCYVRVGNAPTATTSDILIKANIAVLLKVPQHGRPWAVSAVQLSGGGVIYAIPVDAGSL